MNEARLLRVATRALEHSETTPEWWDRDCRCCLVMTAQERETFRDRTGLKDYHIRGGQQVASWRGEEIHASHTPEEILKMPYES